MKAKKAAYLVQALIGAGLVVVGLFFLSANEMRVQFGACIGFGAAFLALGISSLVYSSRLSPEEEQKIARQKEIEVNDERNVRIKEKTASMVMKVMTYLLCAFILILAFMDAGKAIVLMAVGLLTIEFVLTIVFSNHYNKKM